MPRKPSNDVIAFPWETDTRENAPTFDSLLSRTSEEEHDEGSEPDTDDVDAVADEPEDNDENAPVDSDESDEDEDEYEDEDEHSADDDDGDAEEGEPLFTVKVRGEAREVPLSELINGYSRQSDYTRKTQELARHREETEAELVRTREARTHYATRLEALEDILKRAAPPEPDESLMSTDPQRYVIEKARYDKARDKLNAVEEEKQRVKQEQLAAYQQEWTKQAQRNFQKLQEAIPAWQDEKVAEQELTQLSAFARDQYGFTDQELQAMIDPRAILVMRDAMRFAKLDPAGKKKTRSRATLKPGGSKRTPSTAPSAQTRGSKKALRKAKENLARTGSRRDATDAFAELLRQRGE